MSLTGFISDLHLAEEQPQRSALFLRFLEQQVTRLEQLYILGDLFDIWLGDDLISIANQTIIASLKQASKNLPITILRGNRDFLLGEQFEQLSGCRIVEEPLLIELTTGPALLMHGDLLCTEDQAYLAMRKQLRSPEWITAFLAKSAEERRHIANEFRQQSKLAVQDKPYEIMDANEQEVIHYMERFQVTTLIHGHTHRSAIHHHTLTTGEDATRYVLDEWQVDRGQVLLADHQGLHFESVC